MNNNIFAFIITVITALFIVLGSYIGIKIKSKNTNFLSLVLGFSGGIMLYLAFVEILPESKELLSSGFGAEFGNIFATLGFFTGIVIIAFLDKIIPEFDDCCSSSNVSDFSCLYRIGVFSAITLGIHNIPEGFSTFFTVLKDEKLGLTLATAIGIHNITVGLAIGIPIYIATQSKLKSMIYTSISASMTIVGGIIGYFIFSNGLNDKIFGILFSIISGMMVFISLDEILPTAEKYGKHHLVIYGIMSGMAVMALSTIN